MLPVIDRVRGARRHVFEVASAALHRTRVRRGIRRISGLNELTAAERQRIVRSERLVERATSVPAPPTAGFGPAEYLTTDRSVTFLEGVRVIPHYGLIVTPSGRLLEDSVTKRATIEKKLANGRLLQRRPTVRLDGPTHCMVVHPNYYHFWRETLLPLALLHEPEVAALDRIIVTTTRDLDPWRREAVAAALPANAQLLRVDETAIVEAPTVVLPSPYRSVALSRSAVEHLRRCAAAIGGPDRAGSVQPGGMARPGSERPALYVSRGLARRRRPLNEDELLQELDARGATTVVAEDLSPGDQMQHFASAGAIIGQHGAGLTNLLGCPPGTAVLEIHSGPLSEARTHYVGLSASLGLEYHALSTGPMEHPDDDVVLPIPPILDWIDRWGRRTD